MAVILRTHGGLGNQLFQVLYGRLLAEQAGSDLWEIHDARYRHGFARSAELRRAVHPPTSLQRAVSALRLPKLMQRSLGMPERPLGVFGDIYLDGYFQDATAYAGFAPAVLQRHLRQLADELGIRPAHVDRSLVHLRLGDFFASRDDARRHVEQRLATMPADAAVMTNDEALLGEPAIAAMLAARGCELVSTAGFAAEAVLRTMSAYRRFDANDSTMIFWASVLGGGEVALRHAGLRATQELFAAALRPTA